MFLDLICSVDTQPLRRIAGKEAGQEAPSLRTNLIAEDERILENLLIHLVRDFCIITLEIFRSNGVNIITDHHRTEEDQRAFHKEEHRASTNLWFYLHLIP